LQKDIYDIEPPSQKQIEKYLIKNAATLPNGGIGQAESEALLGTSSINISTSLNANMLEKIDISLRPESFQTSKNRNKSKNRNIKSGHKSSNQTSTHQSVYRASSTLVTTKSKTKNVR